VVNFEVFDEHAGQYEAWFKRNRFAYESELQAVKALLPESGEGVEIGVGSGRFANPLGIKVGVEPSSKMRGIALSRGIEVVDGVAEKLPFDDAEFDFALMVTIICFLDDVEKALKEAHRILKPGGAIIVGFIDKNSPVGEFYQQYKDESVFYRAASFYSVNEVINHLKKAGFSNFTFTQTIFHKLTEIEEIEPTKEGYGEGSFVVVRGEKC